MKLCECGCGREVRSGNRFIFNHHGKKYWQQFKLEHENKHFCQCGCDREIIIKPHHRYYGIPRFIQGHGTKNMSIETCRKISKTKMGHIVTQEQRNKISRSHIDINNKKLERFKQEHQGKHFCECGCGQEIEIKPIHKRHSRIPRYIKGHESRGRRLSDETKRKISEAGKGKRHSEESKIKMSKTRTGKYRGVNSPNWQGGVTSDVHLIRASLECRRWQKLIKKRDRYHCQYCGTLKDLQIHHIKGFTAFPELRFDVNNGITLCKKCHGSIKAHEKEHEQTLTMIATQKMIINW
jgi:5-methylcytosine-specific restriction endonuclease McrA